MTFKEEIKALRGRIAKAETERDTWRTSGMQEKYLEAYSAVEALELQLERLRRQGLQAFAKAEAAAPATHTMPAPAMLEEPDEMQRALMSELDIAFRDGIYHLGEHRYDRLSHAVRRRRIVEVR